MVLALRTIEGSELAFFLQLSNIYYESGSIKVFEQYVLECPKFPKSSHIFLHATYITHMGTCKSHTKNEWAHSSLTASHGLFGFGLTVLEAENSRSSDRPKIEILLINPYLLIPKWAKTSKSDQNCYTLIFASLFSAAETAELKCCEKLL